jgi:hypothetical protein
LLLVIALHFVVGSIAGSMFTVRTLLALVVVALAECVTAAIALGFTAGVCLLGAWVAVQIGYFGGVCLRSVLECIGIAQPYVRQPAGNQSTRT